MNDIFDDKNQMKSSQVQWGKVGDKVYGTYVGVKHGIETKFGISSLYSIKTDGGEFHAIAEDKSVAKEATKVPAGEIWDFWGKPDSFFAGEMAKIKAGQKIGVKFIESQPSKKGNPAKIIKVFTEGKMDEDWLKDQAGLNENLDPDAQPF